MKIPEEFNGKYFYHFTHVENIESILKYGILSTNKKKEKNVHHVDLANEIIQKRRSDMVVSCAPYGKIHDYVPFYFASTNPMLLSVVNRKNIDQPLVVFIAISIEKLLNHNVVFTDAAANATRSPNFYNNPEDLYHLNWEEIDSKKWGSNDKHARMAEVLIFEQVPIDYIDYYIVFNNIARKVINKKYKENGLDLPKISKEPFKGRYFYFTKFLIEGRENETLIIGPTFLNHYFTNLVEEIKVDRRKKNPRGQFVFVDIDDAVTKLNKDFCCIDEMEGIFDLHTDNKIHRNTVSEHTLEVVNNVIENAYYSDLSNRDKKIVQLAAFLHDIGKGPKTKWKNQIQPVYQDHPADAIPMLKRILTEDFESLTDYELRKICLLVIYHDIIGDILKDDVGRSEKELLNLDIDEKELNMLICLSLADISAINSWWAFVVKQKLPKFTERILKEINWDD